MAMQRPRQSLSIPLAAGLVASLLALGIRQVGLFEGGELGVYDQFTRASKNLGPDQRLTTITITDNDLKTHGYPVPDRILDQALGILENNAVNVIGLDLYRDQPKEPLATRFKTATNIVVVTKIGTQGEAAVAPPPGVYTDMVGASDVIADKGGVLRRSLVSASVKNESIYSFSFVLSRYYLLTTKNIALNKSPQNPEYLMLGKAVLTPLDTNAGGYQGTDARGYQLLIRYRSPTPTATFTLTELLNQQVPKAAIKGKIVLIGQTAQSVRDVFYTPYSQFEEDKKMPGVLIQGQMVSQLVEAALDERPLLQYWPDGFEALWIGVWGLAGALGISLLPNALARGGAAVGGSAMILGSGFLLFQVGTWVPVLPPVLAMLLSMGASAWVIRTRPSATPPPTAREDDESDATILKPVPNAYKTQSRTTVKDAKTSFIAARPVQLGSFIDPKNRYRLESRLGGGGMGDVYLALDTVVGKQVALKLLKDTIGDRPGFRQRFEREVAIAAALSGDHVVQVSDFGLTNEGNPFYIMEYLRGKTLGQILKQETRLTVKRTLSLATQMCAGLSPAHRGVLLLNQSSEPIRVVHRDLKPDNIFLVATGLGELVKILDFGIVKLLDYEEERTNLTATGQFLGTSRYAAPEQWREQDDLDNRADIYALGVIFYEMLTGTNPFNLPTEKTSMGAWYEGHVFKEALPLRSQPGCETIPPDLEAIVLRCLAKDPTQRFMSVDELNLELQRVVI